MTAQYTDQKGIIAWFASNHVAANLLMVLILAFGIAAAFTVRKQSTPDITLNQIAINVPYLGAAPQEVEEGVLIKIEEAIADIEGINKINSTAREGMGSVNIEVKSEADLNVVLADIKNRVDAIATFPGLTEKPVIYEQKIPFHVVFVSVFGDLDPFGLKALSQEIRDELVAIPSVNRVEVLGDRPYEISVEVSERVLRQYGLTMSEISQAIRNSSIDMPGGTIKSEGGHILLRTEGQIYTGDEFKDLVLRTYPDGTRLLLGDIASIRDEFVETEGWGTFDSQPTVSLRVLALGQQNELDTAAAVKQYVKEKSSTLPDGVNMEIWIDRSFYLQGRLDLMVENMLMGGLVVFIILAVFVRLRVAAWVIVGIPIAFFGALWLMPYGPWPTTINMISLFGFILVLGIVVDDAIIIAESVYTKIRADGHTLDNVILGAKKVATPATFGVLTTIAVFAPMLFVGGFAGPFFEAMSVVIVLCLMFSLVESKLILPTHLAHMKLHVEPDTQIFRPYNEVGLLQRLPMLFKRFQRRVQLGLHSLIRNRYEPLLKKALANRGLTVTIFLSMMIITTGVLQSGLVRVVMFPEIPSDFLLLSVNMQDGSSAEARNETMQRLDRALHEVRDDFARDNPGVMDPIRHVGAFAMGDNRGMMFIELIKDESRALEGEEITQLWRDKVGKLPGVKEMTFSGGDMMGGGAPISFNLAGPNIDTLAAAAKEFEHELAKYDGLFDIRNSFSSGGREIKLTIKPEAEALGLNMVILGRQVRQAFYGEEAQRIQRGKDEVKVMVRYPREERRSIADLENLRIRTPSGDEVPFYSVADVSYGQAFSQIQRQGRKRVIQVSADLDPERVEPGDVIKDMRENFIPGLLARYPGVSYELEGQSLETQKLVANLTTASLAALFLIYALLAIPLRSYIQPLLIMSVIPFGLIGAVIGHIIMGISVSMFSLFGLIALAGVVVNDSLIMVDFINKARQEGQDMITAVVDSGVQRFRAIVLTSLTTAGGLMPIIFEKSLQAKMVIPMAVSLAFGILFATVITLFLVPCLYVTVGKFREKRQARKARRAGAMAIEPGQA